MVQNINKITTNTGSVILWNNDSIIVSIPKGMYYCHMIDGIVKIKQIGVENIFNIAKTSPIDGETFPLVEDMLEKLSSFSRGGGTGAGGAKAYESLAEAMSETPLPSNGTVFYVTEGSPDSGIYAYDSENLNGYYKVFNLPEQGGSADLMINITHADLLALVNNNGLTPGQQYRITDYVATVNTSVYINFEEYFDARARSNNHAFDIIVTADSTNKLNENARAIRHEGDTYFPLHTKFEEWQIKYTILNDSDHFDWAISEGKGVVYQLIDEFNNDLPYDFKSIQFRRNDVWIYTFGGTTDVSLEGILEGQGCFENKMKPVYSYLTEQEGAYGLNNNTFGDYCDSNTFGDDCFLNTFGDYCSLNTFESSVSLNTFRYGCIYNTFKEGCSENTFESNCNFNTLGEACSSNTFVHNCDSNTFGNSCSGNSFGKSCSGNSFKEGCSENTFVSDCKSNTFGSDCNSNTFGSSCDSNTFGNSCSGNSFGNSCSENSFREGCSENTFESNCNFNTFGINCFSNTLGSSCFSNTFGNNCSENTLGEGYANYNISNYIQNINFTNQITNFTTPPNRNVVNVIKTPNGVTFSQVINATTTEAFDV